MMLPKAADGTGTLSVTTVRLSDTAPLQDDELLLLVVQGDLHALEAIYDRYSHLVFSLALHITGDQSSAEGVTEDVFHAVWNEARTVQAMPGSTPAWILSITRHRALDELRSLAYRARHRDDWITFAPVARLRPGGTVVQPAAFREDVRAILAALPAEQHHALVLAYYGGLSTDEIAVTLNVCPATVKTWLRLSLTSLRAACGDGE